MPVPGREFALEKVSFSVGQIVTGGCQFAIGRKDTPVHISKQGYIAKLRWIEQRYVVMWDEGDKRGWLVKGTSALLHLLRASLAHCRKDKFSSEFLYDEIAFQEPPTRFRNDSAIQALINQTNRALRLYKLKEESVDETVKRDGAWFTETKTRTTYTTVEDRVTELFEVLEKLIDHEAQGEASAKGIDMKPRIHSHLRGWDFRDIATNRDPLYMKVATLPSSGGIWTDFIKSLRSVTLLGRGFGQLIRPGPSTTPVLWHAVPTGEGFLTACTADLRDIIDSEGDWTTKPPTLTAGIMWHNSSQRNPVSPNECQSPIQELIPSNSKFRGLFSSTRGSASVDLNDSKHGAVIFGRCKSSRLTRPDVGDPLAIAPSTESDALDEDMEDAKLHTAEDSSDISVKSMQTSTNWTGAEGRDTRLTTPLGSGLSGVDSDQSPSPIPSFVATPDSRPQTGSTGIGPAEGPETVASAPGVGSGSSPGMSARKRGASELEGDESQRRGLAKRLKEASLSAGFWRGPRDASRSRRG